jgi:hypothetical protein
MTLNEEGNQKVQVIRLKVVKVLGNSVLVQYGGNGGYDAHNALIE